MDYYAGIFQMVANFIEYVHIPGKHKAKILTYFSIYFFFKSGNAA